MCGSTVDVATVNPLTLQERQYKGLHDDLLALMGLVCFLPARAHTLPSARRLVLTMGFGYAVEVISSHCTIAFYAELRRLLISVRFVLANPAVV